MIEVGATATRRGLTAHQYANIYRWLLTDKTIKALHHGKCIGGDEEINDICLGIGIDTTGHPPLKEKYLSHCRVNLLLPPKDYLERDRDIVIEAKANDGYLIVAPFQDQEPDSYIGSGTWYTYGYAKEQKVRVIMFWPTRPFEIMPFDLGG